MIRRGSLVQLQPDPPDQRTEDSFRRLRTEDRRQEGCVATRHLKVCPLSSVLCLLIRGCSSAGRAPALQAGGHRFDPVHLHHFRRLRTEDRIQIKASRSDTASVLSHLSSVLWTAGCLLFNNTEEVQPHHGEVSRGVAGFRLYVSLIAIESSVVMGATQALK